MKNYKFATLFVTAYLVLYAVLTANNTPYSVVTAMFVLSPFLVIWMALTVLKYARYSGKELNDEEWGYQDKERSELNGDD